MVDDKRQLAGEHKNDEAPEKDYVWQPTSHNTTVTNFYFARLDGWLSDEVVNKFTDSLVQTLSPVATVTLGSYFLMIKKPN